MHTNYKYIFLYLFITVDIIIMIKHRLKKNMCAPLMRSSRNTSSVYLRLFVIFRQVGFTPPYPFNSASTILRPRLPPRADVRWKIDQILHSRYLLRLTFCVTESIILLGYFYLRGRLKEGLKGRVLLYRIPDRILNDRSRPDKRSPAESLFQSNVTPLQTPCHRRSYIDRVNFVFKLIFTFNIHTLVC